MNDITFPEILKSERNRLGWSREKMEQETGIPARTIQTWEHGKTNPAGYTKRYVLAELREQGRSIRGFSEITAVLEECDDYFNQFRILSGSDLHEKIKAALNA